MLSDKLKQRFCKDEKLNIQLFDNALFRQRLRLMNKLEAYQQFEILIQERFHGDEEAYLEEYNRVKEDIIQYIKNSEAFQTLNSANMNAYASPYSFRQSDVYKEHNVGKKFISIDMRHANFSALVSFSMDFKEKFHENFDWNSFMSKFTDIDHIKSSKYIRQVVFGNCNPKRQVAYEKYLMTQLLDELFKRDIVKESDVYSMCSDEIILSADNMSPESLKSIRTIVEQFVKAPLKVEPFLLGRFENTEAYLKGHLDETLSTVIKLEPKCVNPYDAPMIYRKLRGEQKTPNDLLFMHEGRLARYEEFRDVSISWTPPVKEQYKEEQSIIAKTEVEDYDERTENYHTQLFK